MYKHGDEGGGWLGARAETLSLLALLLTTLTLGAVQLPLEL